MEQLDSTIVNTAVPAMAVSLHVTPLSLKAVVTSYILSLGSVHSRERLDGRPFRLPGAWFAVAVAVFTLSSVLCGLAGQRPDAGGSTRGAGHRCGDDDAGWPARDREHVPQVGACCAR